MESRLSGVPQAPLLPNGEIDYEAVMRHPQYAAADRSPGRKLRADWTEGLMALKEADRPQILSPADKSEIDGPVTIELPPEEGEQSGHSTPVAEQRREAPLSQQLAEVNPAEQQRQQAIMLHYYQQQQELAEARREQRQAEYDSVINAMAAEQGNVQQAQNDYAAALQRGDYQGAAEVQGQIARSQARMVQLEQGIESWNESDQNVPPPPQAPPPPCTAADLINSMTALIPEEREWLLRHQDLVNDPTLASFCQEI
jgi:hypothetical protein